MFSLPSSPGLTIAPFDRNRRTSGEGLRGDRCFEVDLEEETEVPIEERLAPEQSENNTKREKGAEGDSLLTSLEPRQQ
jgi:hypothetical protein